MDITYSQQELADAYLILKVLEGEEQSAYLQTVSGAGLAFSITSVSG